jgi:hypothetical protein
MMTAEEHYGSPTTTGNGTLVATVSGNYNWTPKWGRVFGVIATTTGVDIHLPAPALYSSGGPYLYLLCAPGSQNIDLENESSSTLRTLSAGQMCQVWLDMGQVWRASTARSFTVGSVIS